jgi:hypothetical protein
MGENLVLAIFLLVPALCVLLLVKLQRGLRRRGQSARWYEVVAGNALLLFALVGLLCFGGEFYYRFFYDTTDSFAYSKVTLRWFERYWVRNQNGLRDNIHYPLEKQPGRRRVTFIGDSFTAGHGIKSVEDRFANLLRRENPGWEVHAMAMPGYDTGAELRLLEQLLERGYELDLVVLVYCLNDLSDIVPRQQEALRQIGMQSRNRPWLVRTSYFFDVLSYRLSLRRNPNMLGYYELLQEAYRGPLWQTQKCRLLALRDLVGNHGGRFAVVTFPFFHTLGPNYAYESEHQQLQAFWAESGTPHLDLLPIYRPFETEQLIVSPFDAHPNEKAHALAASAIGDFVRENRNLAQPEPRGG